MEHDISKSIQEKIRMAEAGPVAWQKDLVWDRIRDDMPRTRKKYVYYAVAAAVSLIAISLWHTAVRHENRELNARIIALNLAIDEMYQDLVQYPPREKWELPQQCIEEKPVQERTAASKPPVLLTVREDTLSKEPVSGTLQTPEVIVAEQTPTIAAADPVPEKVQRVAPIIGRFDQTSPEIAVTKKKPSRLRVRRDHDSNPGNEQERKIIIARIN